MMPSQSSALHTSVQPHVHISGQQCPFCEQDIPLDKLEEISGRIAAREQEWLAAETDRLRNQHARERAQAETKARFDLEQAQRDAAAAVERITAAAAAREASIRAEAVRAAEEAAQVRLEEMSRARREETAGLQARLQTAEQAKIAAEERTANVSAELETIRTESAAAIQKATEEAAGREGTIRDEVTRMAEVAFHDRVAAAEQAKQTAEKQAAHLSAELETTRTESAAAIQKAAEDAATREEAIRAGAVQTAEAAFQERLAEVEQAKNAADSARQTAETELRTKLAEAGEQLETQKEVHANEINQQREALEKDKIVSVNAERAKSLETQMKLEGQLQDMQRQLQKRTADEHGEGAELELYEVLKAAFEDDKIRRVQKGTPAQTSFTR
jgi:DNA repair exonuclease SbcCD ATPase subunit